MNRKADDKKLKHLKWEEKKWKKNINTRYLKCFDPNKETNNIHINFGLHFMGKTEGEKLKDNNHNDGK